MGKCKSSSSYETTKLTFSCLNNLLCTRKINLYIKVHVLLSNLNYFHLFPFMIGLMSNSAKGSVTMRVIAGQYKGRQLKAVPGKNTRPTTDKVKEATFQIMGPYFEGGKFLDLFAGSGALGIEALSRGMEWGILVDKSPKAIHIIHDNLKALNLEKETVVFRADAFRALHAASKRGLQFDLILLDPPYAKGDYEGLINEIVSLEILNKGAMIYCEHDHSTVLNPLHKSLSLIKQQKYGGTITITIFRNDA